MQIIGRQHRVLLFSVRVMSWILTRAHLIFFKCESLRLQLMIALFGASARNFIGLFGDAFEVATDGFERAEVAELEVFDLALVFLEGDDSFFDVSLADLCLDVLIADFVHHEHSPASHRQAYVLLFLLLLFQSRLLRQILQLHQSFLVLFVFFLDLVTDKTHILASPNYRQLVRIWSCSS